MASSSSANDDAVAEMQIETLLQDDAENCTEDFKEKTNDSKDHIKESNDNLKDSKDDTTENNKSGDEK